MASSNADSSNVGFEPALFNDYVRWALGVGKPMTLEYQKNKNFVTVKINTNFIPTDVCKRCEKKGPHHGIHHVFKITFMILDNGTREMRIFNAHNEQCTIPTDTEAFKTLECVFHSRASSRASAMGNRNAMTCYFYGTLDEDDPCMLYVRTVDLPPQTNI